MRLIIFAACCGVLFVIGIVSGCLAVLGFVRPEAVLLLAWPWLALLSLATLGAYFWLISLRVKQQAATLRDEQPYCTICGDGLDPACPRCGTDAHQQH
jgi:hypothetical protein